MEMVEMDGSSVDDGSSVRCNTSLDIILSGGCNSEDSVSDSNLRQLANKDIIPSPDITAKQTVQYSYNIKTLCRIALLIIVIIIVTGIMQIPITLYATAPSASDGITNGLLDLVDFKSCSVNLEIQEMISYDMVVGVCQSQMNYSTETLSSCNDVQAVTALALVYGLGTMLDSRSCVKDGISFFCNSIAVLCGNINGSSLLTEECVEIRDSNCAVEWRIVGNLLPNVSIPDCSSFDDVANLTFSVAPPPQTCPNGLGVFCDTFCLPICGEASPYSDGITDFHNVWAIVMFVLSIAGAIVAFIAFYFKRETMFKYPVVFIVYAAFLVLFIEISVILPYIIGENLLLCSNDNLIVATQESTVFCQIQGLIIHGGASFLSVLMLFHILHLFGGVAFPFKSKQLWQSKSFKRKAYVVEIIVILICGLLPSVIILSVSGYQFSGFPALCAPNSEPVPVYIYLVSHNVVGVGSVSLLSVTFWIIHKNAKQGSERKANYDAHSGAIKHLLSSFSVAEIKLLILLCYYWVTIIILLTTVSLAIGSSNEIMESTTALISCAAGGMEAVCETTREELQEDVNGNLVLVCLGYTVLALIQWINLVFVIQSSDVKAIYKKLVNSLAKTN